MTSRLITQDIIDCVHKIEGELKKPTGKKIGEIIGSRFGRAISSVTINRVRTVYTPEEYYKKYGPEYYKRSTKSDDNESDPALQIEDVAVSMDDIPAVVHAPKTRNVIEDLFEQYLYIPSQNGYEAKTIAQQVTCVVSALYTLINVFSKDTVGKDNKTSFGKKLLTQLEVISDEIPIVASNQAVIARKQDEIISLLGRLVEQWEGKKENIEEEAKHDPE